MLVPEASIFAIFGRPPILLRCVGGLRFHRSNGSQLICVDKQIAGSSIKRSAGPVRSAQCAWYYQCHLATVGRIHSAALKGMKHLNAITIGFRSHRADVSFAERLSDERRRSDRERLGRPSSFAGHVALGNWALLHRKQWLSREPVKDKYKSHLGHLPNRRNLPAIPPHRDQHRLSGHIVVPNIVVHHLVVPHELAAGSLERYQTVAERIQALAVRAVKIV